MLLRSGRPFYSTQCPSVSRVIASDCSLNDSVGCPSSLLKLPTVLAFIIDETLSAGYSNMQDLQTSVKMNTLLSQWPHRHLPVSWHEIKRVGLLYVCKQDCVQFSPLPCAWHLIIVSGPYTLPQDPHTVTIWLSPNTLTAAVIIFPLPRWWQRVNIGYLRSESVHTRIGKPSR